MFKDSYQSYFGIPVPVNLNYPRTINSSYMAILPSTEFAFDSKIIGLEFYMAVNSYVEFYVSIFMKLKDLISLYFN